MCICRDFNVRKAELIVEYTCVWVNREVRVSLTDAVDQFCTAAVHPIIGVRGSHLGD